MWARQSTKTRENQLITWHRLMQSDVRHHQKLEAADDDRIKGDVARNSQWSAESVNFSSHSSRKFPLSAK
ncbi:hypothetical protein Y032_0013g1955 [Ancylostoma ceylanicum]|nr:hypothetical protein Y032_0013g1955 [Ancylostoma ceylanicum]